MAPFQDNAPKIVGTVITLLLEGVADGPDGLPWLFLHAYHPGRTGYNEFRALLGVPVEFGGDRVEVREGR